MRTGPCAPWCSGEEIESLPAVQAAAQALTQKGTLAAGDLEALCAESAMAASEALYELSGRKFTGNCGPVRVRPLSRPTDDDGRFTRSLSGIDYFSSSVGMMTGIASHYWSMGPSEIDLGAYPVTAIEEVKIDGTTIPPAEYELRNHRVLVRLRTSASATPTDRYGWPTGQIEDLPDTEPGTFSVTYKYGQEPPALGKIAARKLGEYLARPLLGDNKGYPQRVTSISRQGVSAMTVDVIDILNKGMSGIYEVDLFLRAENPNKNARQAAVWSPDTGRPRRTATPS